MAVLNQAFHDCFLIILSENLPDAMFKWEKYAKSTLLPKILTFKVYRDDNNFTDNIISYNFTLPFLQKRLFLKLLMNHN